MDVSSPNQSLEAQFTDFNGISPGHAQCTHKGDKEGPFIYFFIYAVCKLFMRRHEKNLALWPFFYFKKLMLREENHGRWSEENSCIFSLALGAKY